MGNFGRNSLSGKPSETNDTEHNEGDSIKNRTLWIGGAITQQVEEEMLFEIFINAGPIDDIRIPIDRERNQCKNFAFITFHHEESVPYAIDLFDRIRLFGKELVLKHATGGGSSHARSSGRQHSRSISAPGMTNDKIGYQYSQHSMPIYIDQQQQHQQQSPRQRYNEFNAPRYPPQNSYNNYSQPKSYDDYSWQGETSNRNYQYPRNNSYSKEKRDRRYERRSYNDYDRYRR